MELLPNVCYRALCARDPRFDGVFYVGVKTTGVYCRPICPARTPGAARCEFFGSAALAEHAGFRACFRCRPELAPGLAPVDAIERLVQLAAAQIEAGYLNEHTVEDLAGSLGVSSRHLRRALQAQLGVAPAELAQSKRLALAKQLLQDTSLPLAEIAFAAGFSSVRRFNALLSARFGRPPSKLRRAHTATSARSGLGLCLRLDYRPPLDWPALLGFLRMRAIAGVERVEGDEYARCVKLGEHSGVLRVRPLPGRDALELQLSDGLRGHVMPILTRLRALFDLDARPDLIYAHLRRDTRLRPLLRSRAGLRVPGAFDGFETSLRAVLGQQVSVRGATTLSGRLAERFGEPLSTEQAGLTRVFPSADTLAAASIADVRSIGLPEARARTIVSLAQAVSRGELALGPSHEPERVIEQLQTIAGIGPWTAHYLAMRALRWPDAYPSGDLILRKALDVKTTREAEALAERWRPFRAYAVMCLWSEWSARNPSGEPT